MTAYTVTKDNVGRVNAETEAAINLAGYNPNDDETWDRVLAEKAIQLGEEESLTLTYTIDWTGGSNGPLMSVVNGIETNLEDYTGQEVTVIADSGESDSEPLWHVRASDGRVFAAWKSELGL